MHGMSSTGLAILFQLEAVRIVLAVLVRTIIPVLAFDAFQRDTDTHSRHLQTVKIPLEFNTFQDRCQ